MLRFDKWLADAHLSSAPFDLIAGILWHIWRGQNNYIFQSTPPQPGHVVEKAHALSRPCDQWPPRKKNAASFQGSPSQIWRPLDRGRLKVIVDGVFLEESGEDAIAAMCGDSHGRLIDGFV